MDIKDQANKCDAEKMSARTRKSLYSKQIKQFLGMYVKAREEGNLSKMNLEENAEKFAKKIEYLGERLSYKLYLAEMYSYIGKFNKARDILSMYDKSDLTNLEKKQYEKIENGIINHENEAIIRRLCERGKNFQEIMQECERVSTSNRVMMTPKYIKSIINQYNKEQEENER